MKESADVPFSTLVAFSMTMAETRIVLPRFSRELDECVFDAIKARMSECPRPDCPGCTSQNASEYHEKMNELLESRDFEIVLANESREVADDLHLLCSHLREVSEAFPTLQDDFDKLFARLMSRYVRGCENPTCTACTRSVAENRETYRVAEQAVRGRG